MTSNINVIKNLSKFRKICLLLIGVFIIVILLSITNVYAFYHDSITSSILANVVGDFDSGDADINIMIFRENDDGEFERTYAIPAAYYSFNDELTSCSIPCNDGLGNCEYKYDASNKNFLITSNQKLSCKFYFEKESSSDINVYVLVEDADGFYQNPSGTKSYSLMENIPAYGYAYTDTYKCDSTATLTYNSETRKFSVVTSTKNNCYVYFDKSGSADATVNVYVQSVYGSDVYNSVSSIPSNKIYVLNSTKSVCTNSDGSASSATINYTNGYINIVASQKQTCDVYLDLESN